MLTRWSGESSKCETSTSSATVTGSPTTLDKRAAAPGSVAERSDPSGNRMRAVPSSPTLAERAVAGVVGRGVVAPVGQRDGGGADTAKRARFDGAGVDGPGAGGGTRRVGPDKRSSGVDASALSSGRHLLVIRIEMPSSWCYHT